MSYKPIGDYGIIGNMLSAALVGRDGAIDWCCLPRFDSPSSFAALLDDERGGRFQIRPRSLFDSRQEYVTDTNVLRTTFRTGLGVVTLTDFMPCYPDSRGRIRQLPGIYRLADCVSGEMDLEAIFEPSLDYARGQTSMSVSRHGVKARNGTESLALSSSGVTFEASERGFVGGFTLHQGDKVWFVLRHGANAPASPRVNKAMDRLDATVAYWQSKAENCIVSGPWRDHVVRSYLTLHLLIYSRSGAIVAAPTTSLPEEIGGERNWDYRYAWLRDASLTIDAFAHLGHGDEAGRFMKWLLDVCDRCGPKAQILYDIDFKDPLNEKLLDHLKGYRNSRPVRTGNDAYQQRQLDVFGEVLEAAYTYVTIGGHISRRSWRLLQSFVDAACDLWHYPDSGIWEVRGGPQHFVHSKLMCWVAIDRGVELAERLGYGGDIVKWRKAAQDIRDDLLARGWNAQRQAFTQHYDTSALDASNLLMPLFGFLPVSDPRVTSTIERTIEELGHNGFLRRYRTDETDDGLAGSEGAFLWCSFWLVRNMLRMGKLDDAVALYERLLRCSNHVGLFSEMVDPASGEALGNFPQALTHLAVMTAGLELTQAVQDRESRLV